MKKIILTLIIVALVSVAGMNCKTMDKKKIGDKTAVMVAYPVRPVIFGMASGALESCLADLNKAGVTEVTYAAGQSKKSAFRPMSASTTASEACEAIGLK